MDIAVTSTKPDPVECRRHVVPVNQTLSVIGSKWAVNVIVALTGSSMRFSDLKREVAGVSQKMLTQTLRDLERDGLVKRSVTPSIPPRVDYELTELGAELHEPISILAAWTHRNGARIAAARERYDALD